MRRPGLWPAHLWLMSAVLATASVAMQGQWSVIAVVAATNVSAGWLVYGSLRELRDLLWHRTAWSVQKLGPGLAAKEGAPREGD